MTRLDPCISLKRLIVTKDGRSVYDEEFHKGVNVIRGENGSGKSTIADFIFFALGGDLSAWREEAALCDFTFAEVEINGEQLTLKREVSPYQQRPMSLFWGTLSESEASGVEGWEVYPFAGSLKKESFSQVLFRALDIPEALKEDLGSRVTMHQLLRALYVDQKTPFDEVLRSDDFDSIVTRDAIGDLLLGAYDSALYQLRIRLREIEREITQVAADLRGIGAILRDADDVLTVSMLIEKIDAVQQERAGLRDQLNEFESSDLKEEATVEERSVREAQDALREQKEEVREFEERLETLEYEISDSEEFAEALRQRLVALDESESTQQVLGAAEFRFCPACYKQLASPSAGVCPVCKEEADGPLRPNLLRLRHELTAQIRESEGLQEARRRVREDLLKKLPEASSLRDRLQEAYDRLVTAAVTTAEAQRSAIHRRLGYLDRQLEDLAHQLRLARSLEDLEEKHAQLAGDRELVTAQMEARKGRVFQRKQQALDGISAWTVTLLKRDLRREGAFESAEHLTFDFGKNRVAVDGRRNFAASSMVYLKNCFHLALLLTSLDMDFFRYPRFALFDNVEDKGMEPERSHNFQQLVIDHSNAASVEHQIILTTSMIKPELEDSDLVVGPHYTHSNKSLAIA